MPAVLKHIVRYRICFSLLGIGQFDGLHVRSSLGQFKRIFIAVESLFAKLVARSAERVAYFILAISLAGDRAQKIGAAQSFQFEKFACVGLFRPCVKASGCYVKRFLNTCCKRFAFVDSDGIASLQAIEPGMAVLFLAQSITSSFILEPLG